jgi:large subunit ribosomal protein L4
VVVDHLELAERKTKQAVELLARLGAAPKTNKVLVVDVAPDAMFAASTQNLAGVRLVAARDVTARDVMDATRVVVTRDAVERLQTALNPKDATP